MPADVGRLRARSRRYRASRVSLVSGGLQDNSACEGFFGRLKNEMFYGRPWQDVSVDGFMDALDGYIRWYNEARIKMSLGGLSPLEYRKSLGLVA